MKTIIAIFALIAACSAYRPNPCPNSLCEYRPDSRLFRLNEHQRDVFVQCSNGNAHCHRCADHQEFSNKFQVCVRKTVRPHIIHKPHKPCKGHGCKPHPHKNQCPKSLCKSYEGSEFIVFPYPHKPTYYVQCSHGTPVCRQCPEGLIFNNKIKVCDFPPAKKH